MGVCYFEYRSCIDVIGHHYRMRVGHHYHLAPGYSAGFVQIAGVLRTVKELAHDQSRNCKKWRNSIFMPQTRLSCFWYSELSFKMVDRDHHVRRAFAPSMPGTAPVGGSVKISKPVVKTFSRGDHL